MSMTKDERYTCLTSAQVKNQKQIHNDGNGVEFAGCRILYSVKVLVFSHSETRVSVMGLLFS